jgi:glucose/arabinose dehydrogenase
MRVLTRKLGFALGLTALLLAAACGGGGASPATMPPAPPVGSPSALQYATNPCHYRVGEAIPANVPSVVGSVTTWSIAPALPAGLVLDSADGTVSGTPLTESAPASYTVTAANAAGQTTEMLTLEVGAELPAAFASLAPGFVAEVVLEPGAPTPAKIAKFALAPPGDDRIFYLEVDTGNVRVIDPVAGLRPTPFATLNVLNGGHNGLLGLALAPDFAISGHVYVLACVPGDPMTMTSDRIQIVRFTDASDVGTNQTVVVDGLPVSPPMGVNNGGEILFGLDGTLFVSIGDVQMPGNSQAPAATSLAGKILRYDVSSGTGQVPASNPFPGSPEWCRGLRNTFGLAVHPSTGGLFGLDNGPAQDDELNYLAPGLNFEWGGTPSPPVGYKIRGWQTVIVPTALCWHDGTGWGAAYANDLFLVAYDDHKIHRFQMSGAAFVDIDEESDFAAFKLEGSANHPLDVCMAPDGSLYVSTFSGIYRISKQ